jgi:malate dehydrogenase (oxaloacetate-decarboxylating)
MASLASAPALSGSALLRDPLANRGTAFTAEERAAFDLDGLLPRVVETLDEQAARAYEAFSRYHDDLRR